MSYPSHTRRYRALPGQDTHMGHTSFLYFISIETSILPLLAWLKKKKNCPRAHITTCVLFWGVTPRLCKKSIIWWWDTCSTMHWLYCFRAGLGITHLPCSMLFVEGPSFNHMLSINCLRANTTSVLFKKMSRPNHTNGPYTFLSWDFQLTTPWLNS